MSDATRHVVLMVTLQTSASEDVVLDRFVAAINETGIVQLGGRCEVQAAALTAHGHTPSTGVTYLKPQGNGARPPLVEYSLGRSARTSGRIR